jgi:hypothetical protein
MTKWNDPEATVDQKLEFLRQTDKRIQRLTDRINQISMNNANQPQVAAAD